MKIRCLFQKLEPMRKQPKNGSNRMDKVQSGARTIRISDEVLSKVASLAVREVEGVAHLAAHGMMTSPVTIENLGGAVAVTVRVVLKNGYRAVSVAKQIQQTVKQSVQDMTGVTAVNVNVEVSGVEFDV